jgi:sulfur-oxidizing protein SoxY
MTTPPDRVLTRRQALHCSARVAGLLALTGLVPAHAAVAAGRAAFDAPSVNGALQALGAGAAPLESAEVTLTAPDIAENGAVVPLTVSSLLTGIQSLVILVEKNPSILCAVFHLSDAVDANLSTRIKMDQTSPVYGVALMQDGRALFARKDVQVTVGGCGGD